MNSKNKYTNKLSPRKLDPFVSPSSFGTKHKSIDISSAPRSNTNIRQYNGENVENVDDNHPIHGAPDVSSRNNF